MTGGRVVILGPAVGNLAAGMTGRCIDLSHPDGTYDPGRTAGPPFDSDGLRLTRLSVVLAQREGGPERVDELQRLLVAEPRAGSWLAAGLVGQAGRLPTAIWLIEAARELASASRRRTGQDRPIAAQAAVKPAVDYAAARYGEPTAGDALVLSGTPPPSVEPAPSGELSAAIPLGA